VWEQAVKHQFIIKGVLDERKIADYVLYLNNSIGQWLGNAGYFIKALLQL